MLLYEQITLGLDASFTKCTKESEYSMNKHRMFPQVQVKFESFSQKRQKKHFLTLFYLTKETEYYMNKHHIFPQVQVEFESLSQKLQEKLNIFTDHTAIPNSFLNNN